MDWSQYPQPHEGVQGTELDEGHLLALDDASIERRRTVIGRMKERWDDVVKIHNPPPGAAAAFDQMYNPQAGDMVMELTTSFRRDLTAHIQGFGILLVHERQEWACTDEEWARNVAKEKANHEASGLDFDAEQFAKDRFTDTASYIQYGPGADDICRWSNCQFLAVPADLALEDSTR